MPSYIRTIIFVVILLVIGYLLLPYVKVNPNLDNQNQNQNPNSSNEPKIKIFTSDNLGVSFKYNEDQDNNGKADTSVKEDANKVYVYYTQMAPEQGQWVQEFKKEVNETLTAAITRQFLKDYSSKDCFVQTISDYYKSYEAAPPTLPANVEEAVIAYPQTTDPNLPYWQNADKCPPTYSATNGISYFWMDKNHADKYFFFSVGQYAIFADTEGKVTWQDTFQVIK